jgi:xanthine dehydrogenase accessory factor
MDNLVIVRSGGDIATGAIYKLYQSGFRVLILETPNPSAIRRYVAFSEAVYQGSQTVEGVTCVLARSLDEAKDLLAKRQLVMLIDPKGECIKECKPIAVVDAILAKKNLGTIREMANITVALGPGFVAGEDVDAVIETMRGHNLGRVIYNGAAMKNTGTPGVIAGFGKERVIYSSAAGLLRNKKDIGDIVKKGEVIAVVENGDEKVPVYASLDGLLRGMIRDGYPVVERFKIADIDPRESEYDNCFTISDKARCVAGGVLEAILHLRG